MATSRCAPAKTFRALSFTVGLAAAAAALPSPLAAAPAATATASGAWCRKLPAGKRIVKLSLKPETNVADLVAWISSITCKEFVLPGGAAASGKTVTIVSPQLMTPDEAYRLFLVALDSVGLAVYPSGGFLRVIESAKARTSGIPVIIDEPAPESPPSPR